MERRDFIKNSICLSCLGALTSGCGVFIGNNDLKNDRFYYKSKEDLPKRIRIEACSLFAFKNLPLVIKAVHLS